MDNLKKLTEAELLSRLKATDVWLLQDIVMLAWGYDSEGFVWEYKKNGFPVRQYMAALTATNEIQTKTRLSYVKKTDAYGPELAMCLVKKRDFFKWAEYKWAKECPEVKRTVSIWKKYKQAQKKSSPDWDSTHSKAKFLGDKLQTDSFVNYCLTKPPHTFYANMSDIARQVYALLKGDVDVKPLTCKKYIEPRLSYDELMARVKSQQEK